jgi:hypothetical protein
MYTTLQREKIENSLHDLLKEKYSWAVSKISSDGKIAIFKGMRKIWEGNAELAIKYLESLQ